MRRLPRIALLSVLVLAAPALSGCANFDPDNLDIFGLNEKKKLPGERKDLFPEGVPGVSQGIPPEYRMGAQTAAGADAAATAAQQPAAAPVEPEKPKPAPKRTVKRTAPKPTAAAPVAPVQSQQAPAAQQTSQPSSGSAWPAPQPSGTFQR